MKKKLSDKRGFTLAELLIVVAIIAVLAAIAIPIFNSQLEKARVATSIANLRAAYAEAATTVLTERDTTPSAITVTINATTLSSSDFSNLDFKPKADADLTKINGSADEYDITFDFSDESNITFTAADHT